jgi:beta-mannosidase
MYRILPEQGKSSLNGIWQYCIDQNNTGLDQQYYRKTDFAGWKDMVIPNNWYLTGVGDYFGVVWFKTSFRVPGNFAGKQLSCVLTRWIITRMSG